MLQKSLNRLKSWSEAWQLDVSIHKCTILHIGCDSKTSINDCHSYTLGVISYLILLKLQISEIIDNKLWFAKHITSMTRKAHARAALYKTLLQSKETIISF